ncbi:MAG TPA: hypothetical protein VIK62_01290 [Verrucomicrobiae bacterium]
MNLNALKVKISVPIFTLLLALITSGCFSIYGNEKPEAVNAKPTASTPASAPAPALKPIVTPNYSLAAKVISVNIIGRFVVLSFPASQMPKVEQTLFLYRDGLKVAEVRVTGPQQDSNIVADLTSGEAQVGDAVRDQ